MGLLCLANTTAPDVDAAGAPTTDTDLPPSMASMLPLPSRLLSSSIELSAPLVDVWWWSTAHPLMGMRLDLGYIDVRGYVVLKEVQLLADKAGKMTIKYFGSSREHGPSLVSLLNVTALKVDRLAIGLQHVGELACTPPTPQDSRRCVGVQPAHLRQQVLPCGSYESRLTLLLSGANVGNPFHTLHDHVIGTLQTLLELGWVEAVPLGDDELGSGSSSSSAGSGGGDSNTAATPDFGTEGLLKPRFSSSGHHVVTLSKGAMVPTSQAWPHSHLFRHMASEISYAGDLNGTCFRSLAAGLSLTLFTSVHSSNLPLEEEHRRHAAHTMAKLLLGLEQLSRSNPDDAAKLKGMEEGVTAVVWRGRQDSYQHSGPMPADLSAVLGKPVVMVLSRTGSRRIINEPELVRWLLDTFDVAVVQAYCNGTLRDTARLFHSVSAVIGVHGAGFTNLFFAREGTVVVQLFPYGYELFIDKVNGSPTRGSLFHTLSGIMGAPYYEWSNRNKSNVFFHPGDFWPNNQHSNVTFHLHPTEDEEPGASDSRGRPLPWVQSHWVNQDTLIDLSSLEPVLMRALKALPLRSSSSSSSSSSGEADASGGGSDGVGAGR